MAQYSTPQAPPAAEPHRFGALAWTSLILGIVGIVGSPITFFNNLTIVVAGVGLILGIIALFGTRKILVGVGIALCVAGIAFTLAAQSAAGEEFDRQVGGLGVPAIDSEGTAAMDDVVVSGCRVTDDFGYIMTEADVTVTNTTDEVRSYSVTIGVNNDAGARVGQVYAYAEGLAPGQSTTLSGDTGASGVANEDAEPGPAPCALVSVDRFKP